MAQSTVDQGIKIAIGALLAVLAAVIVYTIDDHSVQAGDTAPNFSVTTDNGMRMSPRDFGGKVLVLNFWASWCPPCIQEAPSLNDFQRMLAGSGVVVLGISVDRNEKMYQAFLKRFGVAFPTVRDPSEDINYRYGTYQIPETYIIDRNGKVARKYAGLPDRDGATIPWTDPELISFVKSLL